jgi:hypothetical protein
VVDIDLGRGIDSWSPWEELTVWQNQQGRSQIGQR